VKVLVRRGNVLRLVRWRSREELAADLEYCAAQDERRFQAQRAAEETARIARREELIAKYGRDVVEAIERSMHGHIGG